MLTKIVALGVVLVVVAAEPVRISKQYLAVSDSEEDQQLSRTLPDVSFLIFDIIKAAVGAKFTALGIGVFVIEWLVANSLVIVLGAAAALGLCKVTGKCFNYEKYIPVAQLKSLATPENLDTAEKFLIEAVKKYTEKRNVSSGSDR